MGRRPGGLALWAATCSTRRARSRRQVLLPLAHTLALAHTHTLALTLTLSSSSLRAVLLNAAVSRGAVLCRTPPEPRGGVEVSQGPLGSPAPQPCQGRHAGGARARPRRVLRPRAAQFLTATGASGPPGPRGSPGVFAWACRPRGLRGSPASASCSFPLRRSPLAFLTPFCFFLYSCESYAFCLSSFKGYPRISACMFTGVSGQRRGGSQAGAALPPTLPASQGHVPFRGSRKRRPWTSRCVGVRGSSREPLLATRPSCATCFSGATFPENVLFPVSPERECRWADKST